MNPEPIARALDAPFAPAAAGDWTNGFGPGRLALFISALLLAAYPEVMLGSHSFFNGDFGLFTYPVAYYTHSSFWRGEIPLWNPLSNCGTPFLAQWNTTVCYPLSFLYILFPLPWSLNYFCLGHLVLAGVGMHRLAFRWTANNFAASVAGLAFALNGLSINCLMWTSNLAALSWMPFTILAVERAWREGGRQIGIAALVSGLQMLTGSPEIILLTWVLLASLWLFQAIGRTVATLASGKRFLAVVLLTAGVAAIQLLPFFQLVRLSDRDPGHATSTWEMPAWGWANFVVPLFRTSNAILGTSFQAEQQWTSSYYLGIGIFALALVAAWKVRQSRVYWLAGAALFGMILALGDHGLLYTALRKLFPPLGLARYPIKYVVPAVFAIPLLAAFAVQWHRQQSSPSQNDAMKPMVWVGAALLIAAASILALAQFAPHPGESWARIARNGAERIVFLGLLLGGLVLLPRAGNAQARSALGLGLLILMGLDVLTHAPRQNPTVTRHAYDHSLTLEMSRVPRPGVSRAMLSASMQALLSWSATPNPVVYFIGERRSLFENCNLPEEVPKVNGFFSLNLREQAALTALLYNPTNFPAGLADFLGVSQISSPREFFRWVPRDSALPLVTAGQRPVFAGGPETVEALAAAEFDPRQVVYLPREAQSQVSATSRSAVEIASVRFSAHELSLELNAPQPAMVVIAQSFFPAWRASVDGKPVKLWPANYAFQALEIPSGRHRVSLVYRDRWFQTGGVISALTLLGCVFLIFRGAGPAFGSPRPSAGGGGESQAIIN